MLFLHFSVNFTYLDNFHFILTISLLTYLSILGAQRPSEFPLKPVAFDEGTDKILASHNIITPIQVTSAISPIIPLSKYIQDRGGVVPDTELDHFVEDLRKAQRFLRENAVPGVSVTEDRIAVQLVYHSFFTCI